MKPVRYNFVIPKTFGYSLEALQQADLMEHWRLCCRGEFCWSFQTYHMLKDQGMDLTLSHALDAGAVNLAHGNTLRALPKRHPYYCVSLQADYPHYPLAHYHVVQNQAQVALRSVFMPLWPQIGQAERDPAREGVRTVAYQGALEFTDLNRERINADLAADGIEFRLLDEDRWQGLRDIDVLVGVRQFGLREYKRKPPSKLINAWHAGIPFIGGWDSAYLQIGCPDRDYLRIATYEAMIEAIRRLAQEPALYRTLVETGRRRTQEYSFDRMIGRWKTLLRRDVAEDYLAWQEQHTRRLIFEAKYCRYLANSSFRGAVRSLYGIDGVKRLRDRYYDPVK